MTVSELIAKLSDMPPMMEVWQLVHPSGLNRTTDVKKDENLGIVELFYDC